MHHNLPPPACPTRVTLNLMQTTHQSEISVKIYKLQTRQAGANNFYNKHETYLNVKLYNPFLLDKHFVRMSQIHKTVRRIPLVVASG